MTYDENKREFVGTLENVPIPTRPVVHLELQDEAEIEVSLESLKASKEPHPIIFLQYAASLTNVFERFKMALNPDTFILRDGGTLEEAVVKAAVEATKLDCKTPVDILKEMVGQQEPAFAITAKLLEPEVDAAEVVDQFIAEMCGSAV